MIKLYKLHAPTIILDNERRMLAERVEMHDRFARILHLPEWPRDLFRMMADDYRRVPRD